jgi:hypothetical protein
MYEKNIPILTKYSLCLLENICVTLGGHALQLTVGIPIAINCAHLLTDTHEAYIMQGSLDKTKST